MKEALVVLILGTATPGGGFPLYGDAFAEMVNAQEPKHSRRAAQHQGLDRERAAARSGQARHRARRGRDRERRARRIAGRRLRIVAAMYSSPGMFIVRADSPYRTIADLRASRWCWERRLRA